MFYLSLTKITGISSQNAGISCPKDVVKCSESARSRSHSEFPKPCTVLSKGYRNVPQRSCMRCFERWHCGSEEGIWAVPVSTLSISESLTCQQCLRLRQAAAGGISASQRRHVQLNWKQKEHTKYLLWKLKSDLPTASFALAFLLTQESQYLLLPDSYGLATNTYLHEAQHYQGFWQ